MLCVERRIHKRLLITPREGRKKERRKKERRLLPRDLTSLNQLDRQKHNLFMTDGRQLGRRHIEEEAAAAAETCSYIGEMGIEVAK